MNCISCGTFISGNNQEYCPHCGMNVQIQRRVEYLSRYYYNQGLEKATIRDLSGAISCLKQSIMFDKKNIPARNLLGLVYFETGEVVAALSEWVISKNIQPRGNLASEYIQQLQASPAKLEAINETIRKYNHALVLCRECHEDMAAIQLKRILAQNSKLIKGYHLLALIQIKEQDYNRARRTLRKAARIDKTNTTTLRFLKEIDTQTGTSTRLEENKKHLIKTPFSSSGKKEKEEDIDVTQDVYREPSGISGILAGVLGFALGAAALWFFVFPSVRQSIYKEANQQIIQYSESLASQSAELSKVQGEVQQTTDTADAMSEQIQSEKLKSESATNLLMAYYYYRNDLLDDAALSLQKVYIDKLDTALTDIYNTVSQATGVTGISSADVAAADEAGQDASAEATDTSADTSQATDTAYDETYDTSYDEAYDTSYDEAYDTDYDASYDTGYDTTYDNYG